MQDRLIRCWKCGGRGYTEKYMELHSTDSHWYRGYCEACGGEGELLISETYVAWDDERIW
ncbi:MAG TPA: hypothetical protein ENI23_10040 [bacterium]|nr:hypothetical protein [bacterium]